MKRILLLLFFCCFVSAALGQGCPQDTQDGSGSSAVSKVLRGRLIYHDGIRKWFELKLDQPACGQHSIQIISGDKNRTSTETLRGCRVSSTGPVFESPTGYYSLDFFQEPSKIEPVGACSKQKPLPATPTAEPAENIDQYKVEMLVDYEPGDHPVAFRITSKGMELKPWQAYASYSLTGGFVLYGNCGKGFVVDTVSGTPEASPSHFTEPRDESDQAVFDPENAASAGKKNMSLKFTCVRHP